MMREARIVALLEHPSIVPIHDVGLLDDGRVFYAMKLVQGKRLDQTARDTASLYDLLRIFQKVCEAIAFAHDRGVIHRDLKPENIMVGPFGEVLVMDWGVAKILGISAGVAASDIRQPESHSDDDPLGGQPGDTSGGTILGTPGYMPPEQATGQTELLDWRADVFALGAILYFLLTGRPPHESGEATAAGKNTGARRPVRPRQIDQKIPRALEAICLKAISELREERYATAEGVAEDVVRFLDGDPVSAYPENIFEKAGRWLNKNRFIVLLILAYLIMRLIVFFWVGR
jgi:serine/threonine protein kinase